MGRSALWWRPMALWRVLVVIHPSSMNRKSTEFRCELCHRVADADTTQRARQTWQPLIICERCLREADNQPTRHGHPLGAVS